MKGIAKVSNAGSSTDAFRSKGDIASKKVVEMNDMKWKDKMQTTK